MIWRGHFIFSYGYIYVSHIDGGDETARETHDERRALCLARTLHFVALGTFKTYTFLLLYRRQGNN